LIPWAKQTSRTLALAAEPASRSQASWLSRRRVILLFWIAAIAAVIVMGTIGPAGWDLRICGKAIQSLRDGQNPYAAGNADVQALPNDAALRQHRARSLYAYSPITLPLLRLLSVLPNWLLAMLLAAAAATGFGLQLKAGYSLAGDDERHWLPFLLPALAFFPGLLTDDAILSGNLAYLLYGMTLAAAVPGWKHNRWRWFYLAVLAASAFKLPMLTLLAFPVLVGRRQWVPASGTAAAGMALFAGQALLWPAVFRDYLSTLRIMFDVGHDFGYGPVGVIGEALYRHGQPYSPETSVMFVVFAGALGIFLLSVARQVRQDNLSYELWLPIALVGTFLFNPRIMKYDMAAITVPMLLITWRGVRSFMQQRAARSPEPGAVSDLRLLCIAAACFLLPNLMTVFGPTWWPVELVVLLSVFATGIWMLQRQQPETESQDLAVPVDLIELAVPEEIL
jgi:hypothetical protein